jgi:hypothetical protein
VSSSAAYAASEEIQVYLDDKEDAGQVSVDWHNNYVLSGRSTPQYAGEQAPAHTYRLTPELNVGLTDTLELGVYLLTTRDAQGNWNADGGKVRLKYIAPHQEQGMFWGLNLEVGKQALRVSPNPWNAELKGIVGWRTGPWTVGVNLNADWSLNSGTGPVGADLDFKINYALTGKTQIGLESYNELGTFTHIDPFNTGNKTIYAVIDTEVAGHELNAGLGRGLNNDSDHWIFKFIVNTPF